MPAPAGSVGQPDLVVLSHLRWTWVWQRPQHLLSRLSARRAPRGARTWFVEEPVVSDVAQPTLRHERVEGTAVTRVWLEVPPHPSHSELPSFDAAGCERYGELVAGLLAAEGRPPAPDVWYYTPLGLEVSGPLEPGLQVYDVMDDLASFILAPTGVRERAEQLLADADVVFTGGPSLHRSTTMLRAECVHLFRSGVETAHYREARALRTAHERPVAGYVGVVDERLDLDLIAGLARLLPDWTVRLVGPVYKIKPHVLPDLPNIDYVGQTPYEQLPGVMAGLDVGLLPFALNPATRSISPTKTLEYLAAGLPVVSTRVPDVVADFSGVVHLADDADGFAAACLAVVTDATPDRDRLARPLHERQEWDTIAAEMAAIVEAARAGRYPKTGAATTAAARP